jgi:hypothetical protein
MIYVDDQRSPGSEDTETPGSSAIMMDGVIGALADGDEPIAAVGQPLDAYRAGVDQVLHRTAEPLHGEFVRSARDGRECGRRVLPADVAILMLESANMREECVLS